MKKLVLICCILALAAKAYSQGNPKYNKALADSLGADEYGMKMYVMVILKTGPGVADKDSTARAFAGHMQNIGRLVEVGKLVVAGPFGKNDKNYRGIFILNATMQESPALLDSDPAIKGKFLEAELIPWYGSAALAKYLPYHDQVFKTDL